MSETETQTVKPEPQFVLKMKDPIAMTQTAEYISTIVEECTLELTYEGLTFRSMDPSHVGLIDIVWPDSAFEVYAIEGPRKIGLRVDELLKVLKNFDKKELLEIRSTEDNKLIFGSYEEKFTVRTIETAASSTPLPKLTFNTKFILQKAALKKLKKISVVSEYVTFESEKYLIKGLGKGYSGEYEIKFGSGSEGVTEIEVKENSRATFSLDYLLKWTELAAKYDKDMTIEYSTKMPLRAEIRIENIGRVHFYLAPRIQD